MINIYLINKSKKEYIKKNTINTPLKKIDKPKYILNQNEKSLLKYITFILFILCCYFSFIKGKKITKEVFKSGIFNSIKNSYKLKRVIAPLRY